MDNFFVNQTKGIKLDKVIKKCVFLSVLYILPLPSIKAIEPGEVNHVTEGLRHHHLVAGDIDAERTKKTLFYYLTNLDPGHYFLTQDEADQIINSYSKGISTEIASGTLSTSRLVYDDFHKKAQEKLPELYKILAGCKGENIKTLYSRDWKNQWPKDETELKDIWTKRFEGDLYLEKERKDHGKRTPKEVISARLAKRIKALNEATQDEKDEKFLSALCKSYDPHTDYLGLASLEEFNTTMGLKFCGIGAVLSSDDSGAEITSLSKGGPAAKSGLLKKGDKIIGVSGKDGKIVDMMDIPLNKVITYIRGPKGTPVKLEITRDGKTMLVDLVRDEIQLNDQAAKAAIISNKDDTKIALITIPAFYHDDEGRSVSKDVRALLEEAEKEQVKAVILDLREDGGGSLEEAVDLVSLFKNNCVAVQVKGADGKVQVRSTKETGKKPFDFPMVVLTDRMSASASEIFSGAVQDYGLGVVVGDTCTFGKGTVQSMVDLNRLSRPAFFMGVPLSGSGAKEGSLKMTIQKFYRPSGQSTQEKGVISDIKIPSLSDINGVGETCLPGFLPYDSVPVAEGVKSMEPYTLKILQDKETQRQTGRGEFKTICEKRCRLEDGRKNGTIAVVDVKTGKDRKNKKEIASGILAKEAKIATTYRGGGIGWENGKVISLYEGVRYGGEGDDGQDLTLEDAIEIAKDYAELKKDKEKNANVVSKADVETPKETN